MRPIWICGLTIALAFPATMARAQMDEAADALTSSMPVFASREEGEQFFENKIRPLLAQRCYDCHGEDVQESLLRLDTWEGMQNGGSAGQLLIPGKPEQSLIMSAVRYRDESLQMPPDEKLSDAEIADLERWIAGGAPHPDANGELAPRRRERAQSDFWAFQPPVEQPLPDVQDKSWPTSPIDYFVLARLEQEGLRPAPPADRRTLLRRATFDLTGLPPTPEEIDAFLADESPDAFQRVIDRLLASPRYGERWGRHWLDVARYADSNGLDENVAHGNAWHYRDWVIAALNADKPYDEFITEQLAGDLLPSPDRETRYQRLIATGYLSLGPKVLAEPDERKMEMDIIDEQIDTVGRSLMGLTLGCARCHDHKFDPIATRDYYALAGIFKSTRTMEHFRKVARWWENEIPTPEQMAALESHQQQVQEKKSEIENMVAQANEQLQASLGAGAAMPENPEEHYPEEVKNKLKEARDALAKLEKERPEVRSAMGVVDGEISDVAVHLRGSHLSLGEVVERGFPEVLVRSEAPSIASDRSGRLELAQWLTSDDHPLTSRVMVNRIWRWHFGRGLVASPDNFGQLGDRPSHPELLDWLARRFIADGWSMKQMHRLIMLSSTYQMSSTLDAEAIQKDPDNHLLWRAPLRRLEAEAIRDALLHVGGQIDYSMGGTLLHVKNRDYFFDHTSKDATNYGSPRRSVYLPVVRNNMYDAFTLFDYSDASVMNGDRPSTVVPTQALFMMNSELVEKSAGQLAESLVARDLTDEQRIAELYERAFGRLPTADETADLLAGLAQLTAMNAGEEGGAETAVKEAWHTLCHAVLASNEFIYLR